MNPDLDTLATALYVRIDDLLAAESWVGAASGLWWGSPRSCRTRSWSLWR